MRSPESDSVFGDGPVSREQIITAAHNAGSRPDVVAALERLPERTCPDLRELWEHLPEVPVSVSNG